MAALDVRASGILLHPTSLPGTHWIGDLGPEAHSFAELLGRAGQSWWQMLPVSPIGPGNSPYLARSAFAGEPLLLSLELLRQDGLLEGSEIARRGRKRPRRVDYEAARRHKEPLLRRAFESFRARRRSRALAAFRERHRSWLEDYALFRALADAEGTEAWHRWPLDLRRRRAAAMRRARAELAQEIAYQVFLQYEFDRQWRLLAQHCRSAGVGLIGDVPIFVAHESADVWAHPELFLLDRSGRPRLVAGVPPDYFSATGQLWGNPIYRWNTLKRRGYDWWMNRLRFALDRFDAVRLDHFIGFLRHWAVSARARTATRGRWVRGPGRNFFNRVLETLGEVPIIAEDLGTVTQEVTSLREEFGFPGMRVLQFGFGDDSGTSEHLPYNYPRCCVCYTGTHDNDTVVGWYRDLARRARGRGGAGARRELSYLHRFLGSSGREIHWDMIRRLLGSPANLAMIPLQDVLGLGTAARTNRPGIALGNWEWRVGQGDVDRRTCDRLRSLTQTYGRLPAGRRAQ